MSLRPIENSHVTEYALYITCMYVCSIPALCALAIFLVISIAVKVIYRTANAAHHKHMICHIPLIHITAFAD